MANEPDLPGTIPRSSIAIAVHPDLRGPFAGMARGRRLVIGYYAAARCGTVVGDLSLRWRSETPAPWYRRLAPIDGVEVYADERLLGVLAIGLPELRPGSLLRRGAPTLRLSRPECWIDFLEGPTVMSTRGRRSG